MTCEEVSAYCPVSLFGKYVYKHAQFILWPSPLQGANRMRMRLGSMGSFDRVSILYELYSPVHRRCEFQ